MTDSNAVSNRSVLEIVALLMGLFVTVIGLLNVLPSYGFLPRVGPFPVAWFRPLFYGASIVTAVLVYLNGRHSSGKLSWPEAVGWVLVTAAAIWICWDYYTVYKILTESVMFFTAREAWMATAMAAITLVLCWALWGLPIAVLGLLAFLYLATGQHWPGVLQTAPVNWVEAVAQNIWYDADQGMVGSIMAIILSTVLPFIILGGILDGVGAGQSMIRISFHLMRHLRGGPAYAAIVASAMFGTVSGSAVANVVGTGVVTIPMIKRRGFSANFAGAVEATASTGGQILPPIMGAAALVMADYVGVSYLTVILAVIVPALAYYVALFLAVAFECARLGDRIHMTGDDTEVSTQDWLNLVLVFAPIILIVWLLVGGMSPAGASIAAIFLLIPLSAINPEIRRNPLRLLAALADGGQTVAKLAIAIGVVGIIVSVLSATGVPTKFAVLLNSAFDASLFLALLITAIGCVVLGMGMPTLPAYIAIIVVMGPTLSDLGVATLTSHMFVFFFGVAAGITPPVAIAAYAASAISKGRPLGTAIEATRVGAMIFVIPFAFVYNPILLGVNDTGASFAFGQWGWAVICLGVALYMCSSALIGFDRLRLSFLERLLRLALVFATLSPEIAINIAGCAVAVILIGLHFVKSRKSVDGSALS